MVDRLALTPREQTALELMAHGHTARETARHMGVGQYHVEKLWRNARLKLGVRHNFQAVGVAFRKGILE